MTLKSESEILEAIVGLRRVIAQLKKLSRKSINNSNLDADNKEQYDYECNIEIKNTRTIIGILLWILNTYEEDKKISHLGLYEIGYYIDEIVTKMRNGEQFDFGGK